MPGRVLALAAMLCLLAAGAAPAARTPGLSPLDASYPGQRPSLEWGSDIEGALARARVSLKPILLLFTAPDCPACYRLKIGPLRNEAIFDVLRKFERVEIDVARRGELALRHQVRAIPAFRVLEPDGRQKGGVDGYLSSGALSTALDKLVTPPRPDVDVQTLLTRIRRGRTRTNDWAAAMLAFGMAENRPDVRAAVLQAPVTNRQSLVECLGDPRLAIRLGALDLLEELAGDPRDFDPWADPGAPVQRAALDGWRTWAAGTNTGGTVYAALTREQFERAVQDLVGDNPDRARRALRVLAQGGETVTHGFAAYLESRPDLGDAAVRRVREVQYALVIPPASGLNALAAAHRLVWGNQDVQLQTIRRLSDCGPAAMPILLDLLKSPESLIREAAAETALAAAGRYAVQPLQEHLQAETDPDVCYAALRRLGKINTRRSLATLEQFFGHDNEDLAIVAVQGAAAVSLPSMVMKLLPLLEDDRWRVRVAVLQAFESLETHKSEVAPAVFARLDDPDGFVRHSAVTTIAKLRLKDAENRLKDAYDRHADIRGVAAGALLSMGHSLPNRFADDLFAGEPGGLLLALDAVGEVRPSSRSLVLRAARSENPDVACTALRVIAGSDERDGGDNAVLIRALRNGPPEYRLTAIQEFDVSYRQHAELRNTIRKLSTGTTLPRHSKGAGAKVDTLRRLIFPAPRRRAETATPPSNATSADVLLAVEAVMQDDTATDLVRQNATLLLCRYGHRGAFNRARDAWPSLTATERAGIAGCLAHFPGPAMPLFKQAVRDNSALVWESAVRQLGNAQGRRFAQPLLEYLAEPGTRLLPSMVWPYGLHDFCGEAPEQAAPAARQILARSTNTTELTVLALYMLSAAKPTQPDVERTLALTTHEDPFVRRAAWLVVCASGIDGVMQHTAAIRGDPAWQVRECLASYFHAPQYQRRVDIHFSADVCFTGYSALRIGGRSARGYSSRSRRGLDGRVREVLTAMGNDDADAWIRYRCLMALLSHHIPVDLNAVAAAGRATGRRRAVALVLDDFLDDHGEYLGRSFAVLLPLLRTPDGEEYGSEAPPLRKRWGMQEAPAESMAAAIAFASRSRAVAPAMAEFSDTPSPQTPHANVSDPLPVVFFTTPGCRECADVKRMLTDLQAEFPYLTVTVRSVRRPDGIKLNEVLCRRFGVPPGDRAVTPAVFTASGHLAGGDISRPALRELCMRSLDAVADADWMNVTEEELASAASDIETRGRSFTLALVLYAGLVDGLNPCAFAAIVFLISYLRVRKRAGRDIVRIGCAYVAGVFLTYFALGLGLSEIVSRLVVMERLTRYMNRAMAALMLVIAFLSFRDGIRCLRGRADDMTLQLPGPLKRGIHAAVRHGTRQRRFMLAAALLGVAVSLLELACTGQVYAPTIIFMIQSGAARPKALLLLLAYNAAFVLPLVVVFVFTAAGTGSARLQGFMVRHMAPVKFAMALLFAVLFVFFVLHAPV